MRERGSEKGCDDTVNARDVFKVGDRVRLTPLGRDRLKGISGTVGHTLTTRGTVVGFSHRPFLVGIVRDGTKMRMNYHADFWKVVK